MAMALLGMRPVLGADHSFCCVWAYEYTRVDYRPVQSIGRLVTVGDKHYQRPCCRDGDTGIAGECDLREALLLSYYWREGAGRFCCRHHQRLCEGDLTARDCQMEC